MPDPPAEDLRRFVRDVPDFPSDGILFKDISPLLGDAGALRLAIDGLVAYAAPLQVDTVLAAEARGYPLGGALAAELGAGFAFARKPGKLPYETVAVEYLLEYGPDRLELHTDALAPGSRVLIHDDLLATGGTAQALCELVERLGATVVGCAFLIELAFLNGREVLGSRDVHALVRYDQPGG